FIRDRSIWSGKASELLNALNEEVGDLAFKDGWPKAPNHLRRRLNYIRTALDDIGLQTSFSKTDAGRLIVLKNLERTKAGVDNASKQKPKVRAPLGKGLS